MDHQWLPAQVCRKVCGGRGITSKTNNRINSMLTNQLHNLKRGNEKSSGEKDCVCVQPAREGEPCDGKKFKTSLRHKPRLKALLGAQSEHLMTFGAKLLG